MLNTREIFRLLFFAVTLLTVPTGPAVAHYGFWQHRSWQHRSFQHGWPSQFSRRPAQLRQEPSWRRWGSARQTSARTTGRHPYELSLAPKSIGPYNPGNTSGSGYMNASTSRPNRGYPSANGNADRYPGSSSQGAGSSSQGAGSSSQDPGSSSRNADSSSAAGNQPSKTHYTCFVAGTGYCGFYGRPNVSSGSRCFCGQNSGLTR